MEEFRELSPKKTIATIFQDHMANYAVKETINLIDRAILGMTVQFESCICTLDSEAGRKSDGVKKHYPGKIKKDHFYPRNRPFHKMDIKLAHLLGPSG